jgi:diaminopropionate ammonia-lyase
MAGLRNREVSPPAFAALLPIVDAFTTIDDVWAHDAMRALGRPRGEDPQVVAGSSGAAALGGLLALMQDPELADARRRLGLGPASRVLAIVSEGATDPELWRATMSA